MALTFLSQLQPGEGKRRRVFPHPKLSLEACGHGGGAIVVESWQRQPAAAGRVEKMISNPEKCRPDGGPKPALGGEREGGRRPHRLRKEEGQGESAGAGLEKPGDNQRDSFLSSSANIN